MKSEEPLITIAIPTFNRSDYLRKCLESVAREIGYLEQSKQKLVEVLVRDNFSADETEAVVKNFFGVIENITYVKNSENIGPDRNIAECYENSTGKFILVIGDDDILVNGALRWIVDRIENDNFGFLFLRSYSSNLNSLQSPQRLLYCDKVIDARKFVLTLCEKLTFISSMVMKRSLIGTPSSYVGTHLVQTYTAFNVLNQSKQNIISSQYFIAATRANGGVVIAGNRAPLPSVVEVFVENFLQAARAYEDFEKMEKKIKSRLFFRFLVYEIARRKEILTAEAADNLHKHYEHEWYFPIIKPLILANSSWLSRSTLFFISLIARTVNGEFLKIFNYFLNRQRL